MQTGSVGEKPEGEGYDLIKKKETDEVSSFTSSVSLFHEDDKCGLLPVLELLVQFRVFV